MDFILVMVALFLSILPHSSQSHKNQSGQTDHKDRWIWGYVDEPHKNDKQKEKFVIPDVKVPDGDSDSCAAYDPEMPDFSAPGRRISETKCYEYIWDIKKREQTRKRESDCWDKKVEIILQEGGSIPQSAVGGRPAIIGEFPHMGAVGWAVVGGGWEFYCGSSLISPKFLLTAAHCSKVSSLNTNVTDPVPKIVRLSSKNIDTLFSNGTTNNDVLISRIIKHPEYVSPMKYYDIAIIEVDRAVDFTQLMQPACLWTQADTVQLGVGATLTGWGVLDAGSILRPSDLQAAEVDVIDSQKCDGLLNRWCNRKWCGLKEHQLCAGKLEGGVDACQGDSGGPLQVKININGTASNIYYVIGVTSFGIGCGLPELPGVYSRVSSFVDWIESHVWK